MSDLPEGMSLTDKEAKALARLLIADQVKHGEWLLWENVPELGEYAFERLQAAVEFEADKLYERVAALDDYHKVNSHELKARAQ